MPVVPRSLRGSIKQEENWSQRSCSPSGKPRRCSTKYSCEPSTTTDQVERGEQGLISISASLMTPMDRAYPIGNNRIASFSECPHFQGEGFDCLFIMVMTCTMGLRKNAVHGVMKRTWIENRTPRGCDRENFGYRDSDVFLENGTVSYK